MILNLDQAIANSFKNFHTKGFDYICLYRSPELTQKIYFFDGDASKLPEVVNPHDHRYEFYTQTIAGEVENIRFVRSVDEEGIHVFQKFDYLTPLNGGNGFTWAGEESLVAHSRRRYKPRGNYWMAAHELHTIRMVENETVIMLEQYKDVVPVGVPTSTYIRDGKAPELTGLYDKFTADEIIAKLTRLQERVPTFDLPEFQ
ncbi:hypothetical protein PXH69_24760 [Rhodococcus qingshengii]|uniref:Uncharacterized protein n=1 Tax=Rhodococcus qingshengii TaxID=334542 RepID=A0AAW6LLW2_RHOSG|nr:hypothetical protein [Rhodococcus qingshengii]MDE8648183.1 hypothetical protein [Rhodococcus qingshengii]